MDRSVEMIEFAMRKPNFERIESRPFPSGYSLRSFQPGDERHWADIEQRAGEFRTIADGMAAFDREFRPHHNRLNSRMLFLVDANGEPIGTTTAWQGEHDGRQMGRIHWVAIVPDHQGNGLARPLVAAAFERIAQDDNEAYLTTQTWSWRAVALYRSFGFVEVIDGPDVTRAIDIVNAKLAKSRI